MPPPSYRLLVCACLAVLAACHPAEPPAAADAPSAAPRRAVEVTLDEDERRRLGIETTTLVVSARAQETAGYGVVLTHDVIAQSVADVATAEAGQRQSRAALARLQGLAGTPGAFAADALETAQRQAAADDATLALARRKLSATFGQVQPWRRDKSGRVLDSLANGSAKIVRATFPLGSLTGPTPHSLAISRPDQDGKSERWESHEVWTAPADASIPGRSLFALLEDPRDEIGEGERLDVHATTQPAEAGVVVPQSALVLSESQYWCYVETRPGTFLRTAVSTERPAEQGYFMMTGFPAGTRVVTQGAGLLLGRDTGGPAAAE